MRASRSAWFVGAVRAVTVIVVHAGEGQRDGGVGDAGEGGGVFVKFGDCMQP